MILQQERFQSDFHEMWEYLYYSMTCRMGLHIDKIHPYAPELWPLKRSKWSLSMFVTLLQESLQSDFHKSCGTILSELSDGI